MSNPSPRRFYIVHDERGRILGLAPVAMRETRGRFRLGYRPLPGPGQKVTELELPDEHASFLPHELLDFEVAIHPDTGKPHLRRWR